MFEPKILLLFQFAGRNTFVNPCGLIRDVDGVGAQRNHRQDIGFQRIADHQELTGIQIISLEDSLVGDLVLIRNDLDAPKSFSQTRLCEFCFLVEEVSFRNNHQTVALQQFVDALLDTIQERDRRFQHFLAQFHNSPNFRPANTAFG